MTTRTGRPSRRWADAAVALSVAIASCLVPTRLNACSIESPSRFEPLDTEGLVELFLRITLNTRPNVLYRWDGPIVAQILAADGGDADPGLMQAWRHAVGDTVARLRPALSVPIALAVDGGWANLFLFVDLNRTNIKRVSDDLVGVGHLDKASMDWIVDYVLYHDDTSEPSCTTHVIYDEATGALVNAYVFASQALTAEEIVRCADRQLFAAVGFLHPYNWFADSITSVALSASCRLTALDLYMARLLYHPSVAPGMEWDTVEAAVRSVIPQIGTYRPPDPPASD